MLGILKAQFIGNLVYGLLRIGKQVLGRIYDFALDVFLRILSRFLFNKISEVVGRKEYLISKIPYGRQSVGMRLPALEIIVEQGFEAGQHILVRFLAGDELPVIKTHTIVKQQLDISCNKPLAQLVYRMRQFQLYFSQTIEDDAFILVRKVQGFG